MIVMCKQTHTNHAEENFAINFLTQHVHLEIQVWTHSILFDSKPLKWNHVITEEKLDDGHWLENSPRKSLRWLAQQSGVSVGSAWTATKLLHIHPYKNYCCAWT
jgi:hypothetical protein